MLHRTRALRRVAATATVAVAAALALAAVPTAANAGYGGGGTQDQWQVGLSYNCDSLTSDFCLDQNGNPSLGGFWGWFVFSSTAGDHTQGTGDAQLAGCGHNQGGPGGGAGELALDNITWVPGPPSQGVDPPGYTGQMFYLTGYTLTLKGHGSQQSFTTSLSDMFSSGNPGLDGLVNSFLGDSGVPMDPGHYGFHPAPGVSGMTQVSYRPGH